MSITNLKAVALVVRIVRELDRYHGLAYPRRRRSGRPLLKASEGAVAFAGSLEACPQDWLQELEKIDSAPGRPTWPERAARPYDRPAAKPDRHGGELAPEEEARLSLEDALRSLGWLRRAVENGSGPTAARPEVPPQELEKVESAPGSGRPRETFGRSRSPAPDGVARQAENEVAEPCGGSSARDERLGNPRQGPEIAQSGLAAGGLAAAAAPDGREAPAPASPAATTASRPEALRPADCLRPLEGRRHWRIGAPARFSRDEKGWDAPTLGYSLVVTKPRDFGLRNALVWPRPAGRGGNANAQCISGPQEGSLA
jgi:hypothetical protein